MEGNTQMFSVFVFFPPKENSSLSSYSLLRFLPSWETEVFKKLIGISGFTFVDEHCDGSVENTAVCTADLYDADFRVSILCRLCFQCWLLCPHWLLQDEEMGVVIGVSASQEPGWLWSFRTHLPPFKQRTWRPGRLSICLVKPDVANV